MKNTLAAILLFSTTSLSWATCSPGVMKQSSAASKMMAGHESIRGNIKVSDLRQKFAKTIFQPSLSKRDPRISSSFFKDGDTVIVTSGGSQELSAQYKAYDALLDEREHARLYGEKHQVMRINEKIRQLEASFEVPQAAKTRVYSDINIYEMEQAMFQHKREGVQVLRVQRIPGKVASTIKMNARNGVILAATAVTLGLISAEEAISGRLAAERSAKCF